MSDYETTQKRHNIIVGLFVILGICAFVWLILKFGDLPGIVTKLDSFEVFVQFPTATGVQKDTPVRFCGYQIGRVTNLMAPEIRKDMVNGLEYYQTVVILSIDKRYVTIPSCVEVKLMTRGLGSSYIELKQYPGIPVVPLDPNRPETKYLLDRIWLQGSTGMTSEFFPEESQQKLDGLIESLGNLISNANDIMGDKDSKENIMKTLANLAQASKQAKDTLEEFEKLAAAGTTTLENADSKVEDVVAAVVDTSEEIRKFTAAGTSTLKSVDDRTEKLITAMVDTSENLSGVMVELKLVLEKVNNGQGSAAKLLNDGNFYENLLENTEQLQLLLEEMKSFIAEWRDKKIEVKLF
ncbi:MAG TPA: MlaD family protein [Sedimentisphaerales bacterium]|nr:MlaD family protein [Sedimentisphaerales bacterium]